MTTSLPDDRDDSGDSGRADGMPYRLLSTCDVSKVRSVTGTAPDCSTLALPTAADTSITSPAAFKNRLLPARDTVVNGRSLELPGPSTATTLPRRPP